MPQSNSKEAYRPRVRVLAGLCIIGIVINVWMMYFKPELWNVDFNQFYSAAKLVGTEHLYDWDRLQAVELEHDTRMVPFERLPVFAAFIKPLTFLPYWTAREFWAAICVGAAFAFAALSPAAYRSVLVIALCWSFPLVSSLALGQDIALYLLFFGFGTWLLNEKRDLAAGLVFSLCATKFHLALGIPLLLIAKRRWTGVLGGTLGLGLLYLSSCALEGVDWPIHWLALANLPQFDPAVQRMPNLRGLACWLPYAGAVELFGAVVVLSVAYLICQKCEIGTAAAVAMAAGLMTGHHSYAYDALLLVPIIVIVFEAARDTLLSDWAMVMMCPAPYLLLMTEWPYFGQIVVIGFTITALYLLLVKTGGFTGVSTAEPEFRRVPVALRVPDQIKSRADQAHPVRLKCTASPHSGFGAKGVSEIRSD